MNYWRMKTFSICSASYAYVDHDSYLADQLFIQNQVKVNFKKEMVREGSPYRIVFCKISKRDIVKFEEALDKLEDKTFLLGHTDYSQICDEITKTIDNGLKVRKRENETICGT